MRSILHASLVTLGFFAGLLSYDAIASTGISNWLVDAADISQIILALLAFIAVVQLFVMSNQNEILTEQIELAKSDISQRNKREAQRLALEQVHFYSNEIIHKQRDNFIDLQGKQGKVPAELPLLQFTSQEVATMTAGIQEKHQQNMYILDTDTAILNASIHYLNVLESFAMTFTTNYADDQIGRTSLAFPFLETVRELASPIIFSRERRNEPTMYAPVVDLYNRWIH